MGVSLYQSENKHAFMKIKLLVGKTVMIYKFRETPSLKNSTNGDLGHLVLGKSMSKLLWA